MSKKHNAQFAKAVADAEVKDYKAVADAEVKDYKAVADAEVKDDKAVADAEVKDDKGVDDERNAKAVADVKAADAKAVADVKAKDAKAVADVKASEDDKVAEEKKAKAAALTEVHKETIKTTERLILEACFVDDFGNAAPLRNPEVNWTSSDSEIVRCEATSDQHTCDVRPCGKLGTAFVTATAAGEKELSNKFEVTVVSAELATKLGIASKLVSTWQK